MPQDNDLKFYQQMRESLLVQMAALDLKIADCTKLLEPQAPRQRRNLVAERVARLELNRLTGSYKKPPSLKKQPGKKK